MKTSSVRTQSFQNMANFCVSKLIGPLLVFVLTRRASEISALECYRCATVPELPSFKNDNCLTDNLQQQTQSFEQPNSTENGFFQNVLEKMNLIITEKAINFTSEPSCFTYSGFVHDTGKLRVIRYEFIGTPENFTEFKCIPMNVPLIGNGKTCFCQEDMCNNDTNGMHASIPNTTTNTDTSTSTMKPPESKPSTSGVSLSLNTIFLTVLFVMLVTAYRVGTVKLS